MFLSFNFLYNDCFVKIFDGDEVVFIVMDEDLSFYLFVDIKYFVILLYF